MSDMKKLILILSLIPSLCMAGPFAEVSLSARQQYSQLPDEYWNINGQKIELPTWRMYDVNYTKNPYASVMVGYQWKLSPDIKVGLAIRHESSIATGQDRGINDVRISLRWSQE